MEPTKRVSAPRRVEKPIVPGTGSLGRVHGGGDHPSGHPDRSHVSSGGKWEDIVGYSRLVRVGQQIFVTGTTATILGGGHVGDGDAYVQAAQCFRNIEWALEHAGATLKDVVRTRMFVTNIRRDWEAVGRAHSEFVGAVRPATTMVEVSRLIEDWMLVEIEADAVLPLGRP